MEINWKDWPSSLRTKLTFSLLANPFAITYTGMVTTQKGHLGCCLSLYDSPFLLWSELYSGMFTGTCSVGASPSSPSLGGIPKSCSVPSQVASGEKGKSNKGLGGMELSQFGIPSGLPLVHLHPPASKVPVSVRDRLSLTREGKLQWKVCLHPHLEQGGTPPVERSHGCGCHSFLFYR